MKHIVFLALLVSASASGQTLDYKIESLMLDSFYVVETYTAAATKETPRPEVRVSSQLFRDTAQVWLFIANMKKDANAAMEQALKYDQAARLWAAKADALSQLCNGSDWFMGRTADKKQLTQAASNSNTAPPAAQKNGKKPHKKKKK